MGTSLQIATVVAAARCQLRAGTSKLEGVTVSDVARWIGCRYADVREALSVSPVELDAAGLFFDAKLHVVSEVQPQSPQAGLVCVVCRKPIDTVRESYVADGSLQHYRHAAFVEVP